MTSLWKKALLILVSSIALAAGLYVRSRIPELTMEDPRIKWVTVSFIGYLAFSLLAIILICWSYSAFVGFILKLSRREVMKWDALTYIPMWFLLLSHLPARFYLYKEDLFKNNLILWVLVIGGCLYLKCFQFYYLWSKARHSAAINIRERIKDFVYSLKYPKWKRILILFLMSVFIYLFLASGILAPLFPPTGDEPHYLIITHSLLKDHDLTLGNNYHNRDYSNFYPGELPTHTRTGKRGANFQYPTHLFGISLYLVPFYWLGLNLPSIGVLLFVRFGMILLTSLLGIQLYLLLLEQMRQPRVAFYTWLVFTFTVPIVFYSRHIYPEVAVALIAIYLFRKFNTSNFTYTWQFAFWGCAVGLIIWFGLKYGITAGVLSLIFLYFFRRRRRINWRVIYFIIPPLISLFLMFAFIYYMYGVFSPLAIEKGMKKDPPPSTIPLSQMIKVQASMMSGTIFTLFFDQRRGIFIYSPIYFFALMGLYLLIKKNRGMAFLLLSLFIPHLAMYVGFKRTGGYAPPTRPLVLVTWILAAFLAYFLAYNRHRKFHILAKILGAISLWLVILLIFNPNCLYHTNWARDTSREAKLFISVSNLKLNFANFLPSYSLAGSNWYWLPNYIWLGSSLIIFFTYIWTKKRQKESPTSQKTNFGWNLGLIAIIITICFPLFAVFPRVNLQENMKCPMLGNLEASLYRQVKSHYGTELMGFWIKGETEESLIIQSKKKLREIILHLHSPQENLIKAGIYERMHFIKIPLKGKKYVKWIFLPSAHYLEGKDTYYYYLTIRSEKGFFPREVIPGSRDPRYLGVFVRVEVTPF